MKDGLVDSMENATRFPQLHRPSNGNMQTQCEDFPNTKVRNFLDTTDFVLTA